MKNHKKLLTIFSAVFVLVFALACAPAEERTATVEEPVVDTADQPMMQQQPADTAQTGAVTVAQIAENPAAYEGQTVTVRSEVEEVYSPQAMKLDEDQPLAGGIDNDLLVLAGQGLTQQFREDELHEEQVTVTGTVRTFRAAEIERDLGYQLDRTRFEQFENRPVLIATSVERAPATVAGTGTTPATNTGAY